MPVVPGSIGKSEGNPNVTEKEFVEWREIRDEADFYHDAAIMLDERKGEYEGDLFPPVLMSASFACELYSKAIICRYGGYGAVQDNRTHSLKALYDYMLSSIKGFDVQRYDTGYDSRFESEISEISDMFEVWRYRYEYKIGSSHYWFVLQYMEVLKKAAYDEDDGTDPQT